MTDQNARTLLSMKDRLANQEQQREAEFLVKLQGQVGQKYRYTKGKIHKEAILVEIKKRKVLLKRDATAQDSFSVGIKDFADFWKLA